MLLHSSIPLPERIPFFRMHTSQVTSLPETGARKRRNPPQISLINYATALLGILLAAVSIFLDQISTYVFTYLQQAFRQRDSSTSQSSSSLCFICLVTGTVSLALCSQPNGISVVDMYRVRSIRWRGGEVFVGWPKCLQ